MPRLGSPRVNAISNTSGGRGKNDDSANAKRNKAGTAYGESDQDNIQSYNSLNTPPPHVQGILWFNIGAPI
jgi:hypothetical protein